MSLPTLYRFYDDDGQLLYVGQTINPKVRLKEHQRAKSWFDDVSGITLARFNSVAELIEAERSAIVFERPLHNVVHNQPRLGVPVPPPLPPEIPAGPRNAAPPVQRWAYSPAEAAELMSVTRQHVYNLMERGELASVKVGRSRRISRASIEAVIGVDGP